jgi:hypothetical protein
MTSVLISAVAMLRSVARSRTALHLEILALRHQLPVLQRSRPRRLRIAKADRWLWAWLSRAWSGWRSALIIVKPETVVAWHRQGFRVFRTWKSRRLTGRPQVAAAVRELIRIVPDHLRHRTAIRNGSGLGPPTHRRLRPNHGVARSVDWRSLHVTSATNALSDH